MWKVLKGDSSSTDNMANKGPSLSKAAAVLPIVPNSAPHDNDKSQSQDPRIKDKNMNNNQGDSTKIDVQNLFSQASKAQGNDEFTAMFKQLELSSQDKTASSDELGDEVSSRFCLHAVLLNC